MIDEVITNYPWAAFSAVWLLGLGGALLEHKAHGSKQVTAGWLLFLFCVLAYAVSTIEAIGILRWFLAGGALIAWPFVTYCVIRDDAKKGETAV